MPLFGGKKNDSGKAAAAPAPAPAAAKKKAGGPKQGGGAPAQPQAPPPLTKDQYVQDMINAWEETDERLAQLPVEDWEHMKEDILEVTDRLYDIQKYPGDYRADFVMEFKENDFDPMMHATKEIVRETTIRTLFEVDNRADALDELKYCEEFLTRRRQAVKGAHKVEKEIEEGKAASKLLEKEGLLMSNDEIFDQFDILERVLVKVRPLVDKADLKDYVTLRNMDEKFIQGANGAIKKLQAKDFSEWSHFKEDVDLLQQLMVRMQTKFESKEEADSHIKEMKAATKKVKKHIKELEAVDEGEAAGGKKGKAAKKPAPAKKIAAPEKKKAAPEKKKAEKKEPEKKGGWLSKKMGK